MKSWTSEFTSVEPCRIEDINHTMEQGSVIELLTALPIDVKGLSNYTGKKGSMCEKSRVNAQPPLSNLKNHEII